MKFKVGQEVECLIHGKGTVKEIRDERCHPITVYFRPGHEDYYTKTGQHSSDGRITLTTGDWEIKEILPESEFKVGQPVWVKDTDDELWKFRYYSHNIPLYWEHIKPFEGVDPNNE